MRQVYLVERCVASEIDLESYLKLRIILSLEIKLGYFKKISTFRHFRPKARRLAKNNAPTESEERRA